LFQVLLLDAVLPPAVVTVVIAAASCAVFERVVEIEPPLRVVTVDCDS
jgi:hypothetical protein